MPTDATLAVLSPFARDEGIDATHQVALVLDGVGWHTIRQLRISEGIDWIRLPPVFPELQPAQRLSSLIDEPKANRSFADLDELEAVRIQRSQTLRADPATIKAHTLFHWWPPGPARPILS